MENLYYDYEKQAWVRDGRYMNCSHPWEMRCGCFGRDHEGATPLQATAERYERTDETSRA